MGERKWEILANTENSESKLTTDRILVILCKNRGLATDAQRREFFNPTLPRDIVLADVGISEESIKRTIKRFKKARDDGEKVIVYGDYDADGVTAAAIMWETLYSAGLDVTPYIPERFTDGYGINPTSIDSLAEKYPGLSLIITVDNGIVAQEGIGRANELGVDVIVTDHHQAGEALSGVVSVVHTVDTSGSGVAWFTAREIYKALGNKSGRRPVNIDELTSLAAVGTVSDQLPLIGVNRSLVKHGLAELSKTTRPGVVALCSKSGISQKDVGCYEVGFLLGPRLNAMGRMENATDSLRLLCTPNIKRAGELAEKLSATNLERQRTVEEAVLSVRSSFAQEGSRVIVVSDSSYHEGVIGLVAAKLVEEHYRPSIVLSVNGEIAKGSARSIVGFNIIEAILSAEDLLIAGGGHPMAAGFSIYASSIDEFSRRMNEYARPLLTEEILQRRLRVDMGLSFDNLTWELSEKLTLFNPTGIGNPTPTFFTPGVRVLELRALGKDNKHLKLKLQEGKVTIDAIAFGMGELAHTLVAGSICDLVYTFEENVWNGTKSLQLKVKDIKYEQD